MVALIWKFSDSTISNQWGKRWTFFFFFTVHKRIDCVCISCSCTKRLLKCVAGMDSTITDYLKNTREGNILPKLTLALFEALFIIDALASYFLLMARKSKIWVFSHTYPWLLWAGVQSVNKNSLFMVHFYGNHKCLALHNRERGKWENKWLFKNKL